MASCGPPSLVELANFAKERSPYYRELYADLEIDEKTPWHAVPTVQHSKYWTLKQRRRQRSPDKQTDRRDSFQDRRHDWQR
jgi:hypothetical protein